MSQNVLLIYTGGTIGMQASDKGYVPMSGFEDVIRSRLAHSHHSALPDFEMIELNPLIDSANLEPSHWNKIADLIIQNYQQYDGFIILHGTDTMAYSASMLSFMLQGLNKPVILTGSQIPLSELRNDALDNLITSMILAAFHPVNEVCIYFSGRLLRGNRASKVKATGLDAFDSPNFPWLGQIGLHIELHSRLFIPADKENFVSPTFDPKAVSILPIYPGICGQLASSILESEGLKAIILRSYGVGNLPDSNKALLSALRKAHENGIVIVNISQCLQADILQGQYACSEALNEIGVISGGEMTLEAAFCKLHYLLANKLYAEDIRKQFPNSLCGEIDTD
ncbi:asparaginase [Neptuniibacter sp. PT8_73]|uniref:asparaginase n=1 Tax=unclassified Neptuniibacter TaxID=2630693 RepID=UPI0039F6B131